MLSGQCAASTWAWSAASDTRHLRGRQHRTVTCSPWWAACPGVSCCRCCTWSTTTEWRPTSRWTRTLRRARSRRLRCATSAPVSRSPTGARPARRMQRKMPCCARCCDARCQQRRAGHMQVRGGPRQMPAACNTAILAGVCCATCSHGIWLPATRRCCRHVLSQPAPCLCCGAGITGVSTGRMSRWPTTSSHSRWTRPCAAPWTCLPQTWRRARPQDAVRA